MYIIINIEEEYFREIYYPSYRFSKYQISNYGRIMIKKSGKILKPFFDKDGYVKYTLLDDSKSRITTTAHRLVAYTFLNEKPNEVIQHLDDNPRNNYYENLQWSTQKENIEHAIIHGRFDEDRISRHVIIKYDSEMIENIRTMLGEGLKTKEILNQLQIPKGSRERRRVTSLIFDVKNHRSHKRNVQRLSLGGEIPQQE